MYNKARIAQLALNHLADVLNHNRKTEEAKLNYSLYAILAYLVIYNTVHY